MSKKYSILKDNPLIKAARHYEIIMKHVCEHGDLIEMTEISEDEFHITIKPGKEKEYRELIEKVKAEIAAEDDNE